SLVCMADLAIAKRSAKFNFAYTRSGLTPDGGASWFLPRLVGAQRAFDLLATNPTLTAEAARELGILARVVDDADFEREVEQLVSRLAAAPAGALGRLKQMLRAALTNSLEQQFELEGRAIAAQAAKPETLAMLEAFFRRSQR
ncbi:MAG: enoyl-CoA hydratase/isomerase family protein, partial [Gammaproteobacteria bacterium]